MIGKTCIFGRIWARRGVYEQVWFIPKIAGEFGVVAAVQFQEKITIFTLI